MDVLSQIDWHGWLTSYPLYFVAAGVVVLVMIGREMIQRRQKPPETREEADAWWQAIK